MCATAACQANRTQSALGTRNGEYVCRSHGRVKTHVVGLAPAVDLAGELILHGEPVVPVHSQLRHIKPHRGLPGLVRVKIHYNQDGVCGVPALFPRPRPGLPGGSLRDRTGPVEAFGEADQLWLMHVMKALIMQPVQCHMRPSDPVKVSDISTYA